MSGLEVIGGLSAVITIIDVSRKLFDTAQNNLSLANIFRVVGQRLPILLATLEICKARIEAIKESMDASTCEALDKIFDSCNDRATDLQYIFDRITRGENEGWRRRYLKCLKRPGKGKKIEQLMALLTEDVQLLVNNHVVKSATPEQNAQLQDIVEQMNSFQSTTLEQGDSGISFNSSGGQMQNFVNQGKGHFVVNQERVYSQDFGDGKD